jgi:hypothetical protein
MPSTFTSRLEGLTTSVAVKAPCRVATTAAITLSGLQTIDGVALSAGDRVLVKNQSSTIDNGIWIASVGAWTRAADFDGTLDAVGGTQVMVISGSVNGNTYWRVDGVGDVNIGQDGVSLEAALISDSATQTFLPPGTGAEARSVQAKLRDVLSIKDFGAVCDYDGTDGTDDTTSIQAAIDAAHALGIGSVYVPGPSVVYGTLYMKKGVVLWGNNPVGEYYAGDTNVAFGPGLYKPNVTGASAGPVVELCTSSSLYGLCIKNEKLSGATTGAVRFGPMATATNVTYASVVDCSISCLKTGDLSGVTTCRGIFFPASQSGNARYFNRVSNVTVTECDIAIGLQSQCNANNFSNIITRECYIHYQLNGSATECIENSFVGLGLFSINTLSPEAIGFSLTGTVRNNNFIGYNTEMHGVAYSIDSTATAAGVNRFLGQTNEATASYLPAGWDFNTDRGINFQQKTEMLLPSRTTGDRFIFVEGNKFTKFGQVSGTLPEMDEDLGTLTAGSANSRIIARFGASWYNIDAIPNFTCRLRVYADGYGTNGPAIADVEFQYRVTNTSTKAASLDVLTVRNKGSFISGLYFITGETSGDPFAIALVGGNYAALAFGTVTVSLEIEAVTSNNAVPNYTYLSDVSFASEAVTADDVTDAISLLTVADTAI